MSRDFLADAAGAVHELTRVFKLHGVKPPTEIRFASYDDFARAIVALKTSPLCQESPKAGYENTELMGVKLTYDRP